MDKDVLLRAEKVLMSEIDHAEKTRNFRRLVILEERLTAVKCLIKYEDGSDVCDVLIAITD